MGPMQASIESKPTVETPAIELILDKLSSWAWGGIGAVSSIPIGMALGYVTREVFISLVPSYLDDFRLGNLSLNGETKSGDFIFAIVVIGSIFITGALIARASVRQSLSGRSRILILVEASLTVPVLAVIIFSTGKLFSTPIDSPLTLTVLLQILPLIFIRLRHFLAEKTRLAPAGPLDFQAPEYTAQLILSACSGLGALGMTVAIRHLARSLTVPHQVWWLLTAAITLALLVGLVVVFERITQPRVAIGLGAVVVGLPAAFLVLPPLMTTAVNQPVIYPGIKPWSWVLVIAILGVAVAIEFWIRLAQAQSAKGFWQNIPSLSVALILVPIRAVFVPPMVPTDDYHFGELFSPAVLWHSWNQQPYVDVFLPRGVVQNIIPEFVNGVVNDGTATVLATVMPLLAVVVIAIAHVLLRRAVGFILATVMVASVGVANFYLEGDLLVLSILVLLLAFIHTRRNPWLVGTAFVFGNGLSIILYPMMGVASLGLSGLVLAFGVVGSLLDRAPNQKAYVWKLILSVTLSALALALSPAREWVSAAFQYIVSNASSNSEAFGISLEASWKIQQGLDQLLSLSFVGAIFLTLWLGWRLWREARVPNWTTLSRMGLVLVPGVFALGMLGRFLGRVDATHWSLRPSLGSTVTLCIVIPAILALALRAKARKPILVSLGLGLVLVLMSVPVFQGGLLRSALGELPAPDVTLSKQLSDSVPLVGLGQSDAEYVSSLATIREISGNLAPGEPVLNLSNRGLLYGYMDWRMPIPYLAAYNIESTAAEIATIKTLDENPPKVAFLGPGPQHDGGSLTLRNPILSGWLMSNYEPLECSGSYWAINKDVPPEISERLLNCTPTSGATALTSPELWGRSIGGIPDLAKAPAYWGEHANGDLRAQSAQLTSVSERDYAWFALGQSVANATLESLLILDSRCLVKPEPSALGAESSARASIGIFSQGSDTPIESITFVWGEGLFVIPLDAYPRLRGELGNGTEIRLAIPAGSCDGFWAVDAYTRSRD